MSLKRIPLFAVPIIAIVVVIYIVFIRPSTVSPQTVAVTRGAIVQEALASGNVESPTTADLRFATPGILTKLLVQTGDEVRAGDVLAKEDVSTLSAQFAQAQSSISQQQALYQSLVDGTRPEQLAVTQAQIDADTVALDRAVQGESDALTTIMTTLTSTLNNTIDPLFTNPRSSNPLFVPQASDATLINSIQNERLAIGTQTNNVAAQIATIAPATMDAPEQSMITLVRSYTQLLSDINTALSESIQSQPNLQAQLTAWSASVGAARTAVAAVSSTLTSAVTVRQNALAVRDRDTKTLALQAATATQSSLDAQRAALAQAQHAAASVASQMKNYEIIAPFDATVTDTNGTVGETMSANTTVVSLMPHSALDIKVNVSEDSIIGVHLGDPVRIQLDAFPQGTYFHGTVMSIDPAETVIDGAIYYITKVAFTDATAQIKSGMTANVWIETASSSDALIIPASAVARSATSSDVSVRVYNNGTITTRHIETGITDQNGSVQVVSGLTEGERVVVGE